MTGEPFSAAREHFQAGRLAEAAEVCRGALAANPQHADAMHMLGAIAGRQGNHAEAAHWFAAAVTTAPARADFYFNLIYALASLDRLDEAMAAYRQMAALGQINLDLLNALGLAYRKKGNLERAAQLFEAVLVNDIDFFDSLSNLATTLRDMGQTERALAICRQAAALEADNPQVLVNLCGMLAAAGNVAEATKTIERALELKPDLAIARRNRGQLRLLAGDFDGGWEDYEARWKVAGVELGVTPREKWWDGSALNGEKILLLAEQGFGDAIQFIRYATVVAARGGTVIAACRGPLTRLFKTVEGVAEVVDSEQPMPDVAQACPLLNLPGVFKTNLGNIPNSVPYLKPPATDKWRSLFAGYSGLKVGLAWAGGRSFNRDAYRSIPLEKFARFFELSGVQWVSLQKGPGAAEAASMPLLDFTAELTDFADTAALIEELDLVISVDTAIAHLAGAMGKAVWVLVPYAPDWRWMLNRADSPWYPTMRLFRQTRIGDWDQTITDVHAELLTDPRLR